MKKIDLIPIVLAMFSIGLMVVLLTALNSKTVSADDPWYPCGDPGRTGEFEGSMCVVEHPNFQVACDDENANGCLNYCTNKCAEFKNQCGWSWMQEAGCQMGCYQGVHAECTADP